MLDETYPDPGEVPVLDWIDKDKISVDPLYQRPLDRGRVDAILQAFSWRAFGALVVVPVRGEPWHEVRGFYHVTDGQHRLEAAKLHPNVTVVPAIIVTAEDVQAEAGIFVDINKNRKNVSALELFFAQLAAGEKSAIAVQQMCQEVGIRIPKNPGDYKPRDSIAVAAISSVVAGYFSPTVAKNILKTVAAGKFRPITAAQIKAVEHLLTDPEFRDQIQPDDLAALLERDGDMHDSEAKRFAATHKVSTWKGLASVWFQKCRKRRAPADTPRVDFSAQQVGGKNRHETMDAPVKAIPAHLKSAVRPEIAQRAAELAARRAPLPRENVTSSVMGDPPAGRSALDARRTG